MAPLTDDDDDLAGDEELDGHFLIVLRKLGTLCHNRRCTAAELGEAMDAHPRRAREWLDHLQALGLVEREGALGAFTFYPSPEGWKTLEEQ